VIDTLGMITKVSVGFRLDVLQLHFLKIKVTKMLETKRLNV